MDQDLYDITFSGQLMDDVDVDQVSQNLQKLFKSSPDTIARLMNGATHVVKRRTDMDTARKYIVAMQRAGAIAAIRPAEDTTQPVAPVAAPAATPVPSSASAPTPEPVKVDTTEAQDGTLTLAPPGTEVLRADERALVTPVQVNTDHIGLASVFSEAPAQTPPPPPAPDTSHLSAAEVGADLGTGAAPGPAPVMPDISGLDLAEVGARIGQELNELPLPEPDLTGLSLAEPGAPLDEIKPHRQPINPDISHLQLVDNTQ